MCGYLLGILKLVVFKLSLCLDSTTTGFQPVGATTLGSRSLVRDNHMAATFASAQASAPLGSHIWAFATYVEILRVMRAVVTYFSSCKVTTEGEETLLNTQVYVVLDPNWMGGHQVRKCEMREDHGKTFLTIRPLWES
ncbi:uncharacterized protein BCR38DRAFT_431901 [Pseudomassariella vexata]|uniref:Lipocalin-like domain-containing protein n=1 Tax=Pseudomassariella vexata TaxID=1141098 RepID=A0A1Y2E0P6_9PEZI|nr:uncharacterized protein BCR38DRAFT_431901 [Pseudomassariella vexata]ORY65113.1 hypothetical protein BCR38DRAFT_431901 [Pseudomassariella vexata]